MRIRGGRRLARTAGPTRRAGGEPELLQAVVETARAIFEAEAASVLLLDESSKELVFEAGFRARREGASRPAAARQGRRCGFGADGPASRSSSTTSRAILALRREAAESLGYMPDVASWRCRSSSATTRSGCSRCSTPATARVRRQGARAARPLCRPGRDRAHDAEERPQDPGHTHRPADRHDRPRPARPAPQPARGRQARRGGAAARGDDPPARVASRGRPAAFQCRSASWIATTPVCVVAAPASAASFVTNGSPSSSASATNQRVGGGEVPAELPHPRAKRQRGKGERARGRPDPRPPRRHARPAALRAALRAGARQAPRRRARRVQRVPPRARREPRPRRQPRCRAGGQRPPTCRQRSLAAGTDGPHRRLARLAQGKPIPAHGFAPPAPPPSAAPPCAPAPHEDTRTARAPKPPRAPSGCDARRRERRGSERARGYS